MNRHTVYIALMVTVFALFALVFNLLPRTVYSPLEKRVLTVFPKFSTAALQTGDFTRNVSSWYSDTEPYRDFFLQLSMQLKKWGGLAYNEEEAITFHAGDAPVADDAEHETLPDEDPERKPGEYTNNLTADDKAKISNAGIIVVGTGANVRALMAFGGSAKGGVAYAKAANLYKQTFGKQVRVYSMVIPTAVAYYCPDKARSVTRDERATIQNIYAHLDPDVQAVDVYSELGKHASEDIFLRTDHHWAPLGAYYAAAKFAKVAGVPFKPLSAYRRKVVHRYVGSMYGYSKDIALKEAPEDFVYYEPQNIEYQTSYVDYTINNNYRVTGESKARKGPFFYRYKDGNGGAYCTFMGGDTHICTVRTATRNGRRVLILKDSFGNALPGYLFFSFEEVHVVDYRYFTKNMKRYVADNKITDILFANNIFNAYSPKISARYAAFLTQQEGAYQYASPSSGKGKKQKTLSDSIAKPHTGKAKTDSLRHRTPPRTPSVSTEPVIPATTEHTPQ